MKGTLVTRNPHQPRNLEDEFDAFLNGIDVLSPPNYLLATDQTAVKRYGNLENHSQILNNGIISSISSKTTLLLVVKIEKARILDE